MAVVKWARHLCQCTLALFLARISESALAIESKHANRAFHKISGIPFVWFHVVVVCHHALERCEWPVPLHLSYE